MNGHLFGVTGDSISNGIHGLWQPVVTARTGAVNQFNDARRGRAFSQAFECYGSMTPGAPLLVNQGAISTPYGPYANNGKQGNTLAQDLAGLDYYVVFLGTNDFADTIGTINDAVNAGTVYGNLRWIDTTLTQANPSMRIIWVAPYSTTNGSSAAVDAAIETYAKSVGEPVADLGTESGINIKNWPITLIDDLIHPSPWALTHNVGPVISNRMQLAF